MTGYDLSRQWFDFAFANQDKVMTKHGILYFWLIELNNRLGWVENFKVPIETAGAAIGISRPQTVREALYDLAEWGFIRIVVKGSNQNVPNVISLKSCTVESDQSLDNSIRLNDFRLSDDLATDQATFEQPIKRSTSKRLSTVPLSKQENNETNKPVNQQTDVDADRVGLEDGIEDSGLKEKKGTPSKVAPKVSPSVHARIREIIQTENQGYYWQGKDGTATKSIIKKISFRWGEKNGGAPTDDQIVESFIWLVKNLPEWYKNKWDACLIESKFESIVKEIHEQRNGKSNNQLRNDPQAKNGISPRLAEAWELLDKSRKAVPT